MPTVACSALLSFGPPLTDAELDAHAHALRDGGALDDLQRGGHRHEAERIKDLIGKLPPELHKHTCVEMPAEEEPRAQYQSHARLSYEMIHGGVEPSAASAVR